MKLSISIEDMGGTTWPIWQQMVPELEQMGFDTVYRSDHYPIAGEGVTDSLELITALTYLVVHTKKVNFGSMVSPLSVRDPVMLTRQAVLLDILSGGRMILGVGSGWSEGEHNAFGYELGDMKTRFDRLDEGLQVITSLLRDPAPVNFQGHFYKLKDAQLFPRSDHRMPIMVGGKGPKRALPLVARYADVWNCTRTSPDSFRDLSLKLDDLALSEKRRPETIRRTVTKPMIISRTPKDYDESMDLIHKNTPFRSMTNEHINGVVESMQGLVGSPEQLVENIQAYAAAGADEYVIQWFNLQDWHGLEIIAKDVLPHFSS